MKANDEVWEKNLNVSAQDKSNLISITDEKKEIYINKQSLEIADGVNVSKDDLDVDAENRI